jgi:hypothetical protein
LPQQGDLFAHVDDDELRDRVYHDLIRHRPVLGVCTGDGRTDRRPGAGMTELLRIIDVQEDGRDEILYGATLISSKNFYVAVFRRGKLHRVLRPKGKPLLLIKGSEVNPDRGKAFGCRKSADGKIRRLVKASVRKTGARSFRWTRANLSTPGRLGQAHFDRKGAHEIPPPGVSGRRNAR